MKHLFIFFAVISLMSCSSLTPVADFDKKVDFSKYHSFSVCEIGTDFPEKYQEYDNAQSRAIINNLIKNNLVNRGYSFDTVSPDLLISYDLKFKDEVLAITQCRSEDDFEFWDGCTLTEHPYTEGSLVLTAMDNSSSSIVWIGSMEDAWTKIDDKKFEKKMEIFIKYLLQDFPLAL